jgi:protein TonB
MNHAARRLLIATLLLLSACSNAPPPAAPATPARPAAAAHAIPVPLPALATSGQRSQYDNIDAYKVDVAERIMRANPHRIFTHKLPPMLPAIVVLNISVDKDGGLNKVAIARSRDSAASSVALAAVRQCGQLPKPMNLLASRRNALEFSETFLFNAHYQFKLRTLAGPQIVDPD